jgi:hypothetical protein
MIMKLNNCYKIKYVLYINTLNDINVRRVYNYNGKNYCNFLL